MDTLSTPVPRLGNGQCAHRWRNMGRCLELAVTTRPIRWDNVTYEIPLCEDHAAYHDRERIR
jgi:hypothetical protein